MNILFLNYFFDSDLTTESELLHRYRGSLEWCAALLRAGVKEVSVVQRFHRDSTMVVDNITVHFVADGLGNIITPLDTFSRLHNAVLKLQPDVVHHNGWPYPLIQLRKMLPKSTAIVWQHHGGGIPQWYSQFFYKTGFEAVDSFLFTSKELAAPWKELNLINHFHDIYEVIESSSTFSPKDKVDCRTRLGMIGKEIFLWVGRLDNNKDPLTVLAGFKKVLNELQDPHLYMIYHEGNLTQDIERMASESELLGRVHLLGKQPHELLQAYYSAADYFVLGSHREGSGYALLEALACGTMPIVTDISSFRKITNNGEVGTLWNVGDPASLADAIRRASKNIQSQNEVRDFFVPTLSYDALGKNAINAYEATYKKRNSGKKKVAVVVPGGIDSPESGLQIPNLVQLLSKLSLSFDMTIYSMIRISDSNEEYRCGEARVIFLGSHHHHSFLSKFITLLKAFLKDGKRFDLIHGFWALPSGLIALLVSKLFKIPSVVSLLGGETASVPEIQYGNMVHPFLRNLTLSVCNHADAIIVLTSFQQKQLQNIGVNRHNVVVIPFGIEPSLFPHDDKVLPGGEVHFLHVGSIIPVKNHEMLIRAFKLIFEKLPCKLRLVGVDYRNGEIQKLTENLNLQENITFCGYTPYEKMYEHYQWADILLHPSYHEAQGLVVVEAAASQVLVCGTQVGLIADFTPDKALSVSAGDYYSLANTVLDLLNSPELMTSVRKNALRWSQTHTINWSVEQVQNIYQKLLDN
ncbi:MAG: glycosyltransferase [Bacteroidetes bacterium]|nr:MAG: glycosyltransferase [Bacteroidota bacterium]